MRALLDRIRGGEVLLADGAMGTMLFERGLGPGECPERLNLERPELLVDVARLYLAAGSDMVQTNTFGASPLRLAAYGLEARTEDINKAAVDAARKAAGGRAYVLGECGPSGRLLQPHGDTPAQEVYAGFRRQIAALAEAGIDALSIETMTDLAEALLAIQAAREVDPSLTILATMTFDQTPRGFYTAMGNSLADAVRGLKEGGAHAVGSNCGNGVSQMTKIACLMRQATDLPLVIQPNAGLPEPSGGRLRYPETPAFMAERIPDLLAAGVSVVGGCCGTTPDHIKAMRVAIDRTVRGSSSRS
jgi:5-methyltetrahydrofolate--homocysteine methyltransferase